MRQSTSTSSTKSSGHSSRCWPFAPLFLYPTIDIPTSNPRQTISPVDFDCCLAAARDLDQTLLRLLMFRFVTPSFCSIFGISRAAPTISYPCCPTFVLFSFGRSPLSVSPSVYGSLFLSRRAGMGDKWAGSAGMYRPETPFA